MKSFRLIALSALVTVGSFSTIVYTSCTKDACKGVTCQNGGTCDGGTCTCPTGYEGTNCQTESRTKIIKIWSASDVQVSPVVALPTYTSSISAGTATAAVKISNFSGLFTNDVNGTLSGNTITVGTQTPDADTFSVSGSGTYDATSKKITWNYTITNPQNLTRSYTGTWQ
ncbi:MAG: calcium-binding EGF-like domain-containing protein [Taibaiella sp.]|nr:calcium-binding EGF-like domain-containing protein [Taibaiella sp.]